MTILNKLFVVFTIIANIILSLAPSCHSSTNLALYKHYTLSQMPNYALTAQPSDTTALTDGKYSIGYFWAQRSTVGWQGAKAVEILIDLEKESNIGSITFNTARGEKETGVYYPVRIAAFVGTDREHLMYVGDLADDPENQPGSYGTKKFELDNVGIHTRYVLLVAKPKGFFLFCDEIEIIEGTFGQREAGNLTVKTAREFVDQLIRLDGEKVLLNKMAEKVAAMFDKQPGVSRLHEVRQQISAMQSNASAEAIETALLGLRRTELAKKNLTKTLHVQSINPWASLNPVFSVSNAKSTSLSLLTPKDGYDSGAVIITNLSTNPIQVTTALDKIFNGVDLFLYQVPFIKTAELEQVADPLVPADKSFNLRPGESRMLFVTVWGKQSGKWNANLRIKNDGNVTTLPISIQVASVKLPKKLSLNSVNWSYLDFKLIRDCQQSAVADLLAHHTNVVVVPPTYLPNADPVKPLDFSRLESYLKFHRGVDKILLFMNLRTDNRLMLGGGYPFLGEQWKTAVKRWYEGAMQTAVRTGFKTDQVYWYPFDEMHDKEINQFIALAKWARNEIPGVRLCATLANFGGKNPEQALPYLDIAQIHNSAPLSKYITPTKTELWLYDTRTPAKSQSPYSYYRLMAWQAFASGYRGIGFWAYADASGSAWDDFDGKNPDYAVIYEGEGTSIISSRRWEAWRMGIEDYELLTIYSRAKGNAVAKALAKNVLGTPLDTSKADEVRRKILLELSR